MSFAARLLAVSNRRILMVSSPREQPPFQGEDSRVVTARPHLPPLPQQAQNVRRQHHMPVLASLGLHHADDVLSAVDIAGLEADDLRRPAAIAERQHDLEGAETSKVTQELSAISTRCCCAVRISLKSRNGSRAACRHLKRRAAPVTEKRRANGPRHPPRADPRDRSPFRLLRRRHGPDRVPQVAHSLRRQARLLGADR